MTVSVIMLLILAFITQASWHLLQQPLVWLGSSEWHPLNGAFGLLAMLAATLATSAVALALALPLGLCTAIWGRFYAPALLGAAYRAGMGVMASVPSVVYGLWGLVVLVPFINRYFSPGTSVLAGGIVLALMLLPIMVLQADLALDQTAQRHLRGLLALGLSSWAAIRQVLLPTCMQQLRPAIILQAGRAMGETMALLMVCGNVVQMPRSFFTPVRTLTSNIALEMAYATGLHQSALYASGWLLILMVLVLMILARWNTVEGAIHASR